MIKISLNVVKLKQIFEEYYMIQYPIASKYSSNLALKSKYDNNVFIFFSFLAINPSKDYLRALKTSVSVSLTMRPIVSASKFTGPSDRSGILNERRVFS